MGKRFKPKEANKHYFELPAYDEARRREIAPMIKPYGDVTDKYGRLMSRICLILGEVEPTSKQDAVIRDLMADVFDFLYESRHFILKGKTLMAFPLARRAYESLSLLHLCALEPETAEKWASGKKISNHEIRKGLSQKQLGEDEDGLKELYNFYCGLTHPNREMIAFRGLGEGNGFVFGSIGCPNLIELSDYCIKNINMWFWFTATVTYFYKHLIFARDPSYKEVYMTTATEAKSVNEWLIEQYNQLLDEWHHQDDIVSPKHI
jgi:hypothetical protein